MSALVYGLWPSVLCLLSLSTWTLTQCVMSALSTDSDPVCYVCSVYGLWPSVLCLLCLRTLTQCVMSALSTDSDPVCYVCSVYGLPDPVCYVSALSTDSDPECVMSALSTDSDPVCYVCSVYGLWPSSVLCLLCSTDSDPVCYVCSVCLRPLTQCVMSASVYRLWPSVLCLLCLQTLTQCVMSALSTDSDPVCTVDNTNPTEEESVTYSCEVFYTPNISPMQVTWTDEQGQLMESTTDIDDPGHTVSTLTVPAVAPMLQSFSCYVNFTEPTDLETSAMNAPEWEYTWTFPPISVIRMSQTENSFVTYFKVNLSIQRI